MFTTETGETYFENSNEVVSYLSDHFGASEQYILETMPHLSESIDLCGSCNKDDIDRVSRKDLQHILAIELNKVAIIKGISKSDTLQILNMSNIYSDLGTQIEYYESCMVELSTYIQKHLPYILEHNISETSIGWVVEEGYLDSPTRESYFQRTSTGQDTDPKSITGYTKHLQNAKQEFKALIESVCDDNHFKAVIENTNGKLLASHNKDFPPHYIHAHNIRSLYGSNNESLGEHITRAWLMIHRCRETTLLCKTFST